MKRNYVRQMALMLLAAGLIASSSSYAQRPCGGQGKGFDGELRGVRYIGLQLPDLTDEQESKIKKLNLQFEKAILPTKNLIREKEAQLNTRLTQEKVNTSEVNQEIDELADLRSTVRKERVKTNLEIRELLTEDQRIIFDSHWSARRGNRGGPKGMFRRG